MRTTFIFPTLVFLIVFTGCRQSADIHAAPSKSAPELSPQAAAGRKIFFDPSLSASGKQSCSTCHDPAHAYGPPNAFAVQMGGPNLTTPGLRAVPSLRYTLAHNPRWAHPRPTSIIEQLTETDNYPQGGFAWDGRFNTLHDQATHPLLDPSEMASNKETIVHAVEQGAYAEDFRRAFGAGIFSDTDKAFASVLNALERFELEDPSFHPYSSKFDRWLDGKEQLTPREQHGLALFNDPDRGNCASCHLSDCGADGSHPLFTDYQFEAIAVPRNMEIPANRDPHFYDLGLCGPLRSDQKQDSYCGMFKTPGLRNVATRHVFFHNGRFHTLKEMLEFYVERDTNPQKWYPRGKFDDMPAIYREYVDRKTAPFPGTKEGKPVWNGSEIDDVIAFLKTLNDEDHTSTIR